MKVKPNNDIENDGLLTTYGGFGHFVSAEANYFFPEKDSWRQRLCYTMLHWAANDSGEKEEDVLEIMQFCKKYRIPYNTLNNLVRKYPDIADAFREMKLYIASRRRVGSMTKKYDRESCHRDLHRYDPEWKEVDKYHADMKTEDDKRAHTFNITVNKPEITTPEMLKIEVDKTKE